MINLKCKKNTKFVIIYVSFYFWRNIYNQKKKTLHIYQVGLATRCCCWLVFIIRCYYFSYIFILIYNASNLIIGSHFVYVMARTWCDWPRITSISTFCYFHPLGLSPFPSLEIYIFFSTLNTTFILLHGLSFTFPFHSPKISKKSLIDLLLYPFVLANGYIIYIFRYTILACCYFDIRFSNVSFIYWFATFCALYRLLPLLCLYLYLSIFALYKAESFLVHCLSVMSNVQFCGPITAILTANDHHQIK